MLVLTQVLKVGWTRVLPYPQGPWPYPPSLHTPGFPCGACGTLAYTQGLRAQARLSLPRLCYKLTEDRDRGRKTTWIYLNRLDRGQGRAGHAWGARHPQRGEATSLRPGSLQWPLLWRIILCWPLCRLLGQREAAAGGELLWHGGSIWAAHWGVSPHSPVAIQAYSGQLSTLPTWKKRDQFSHELEAIDYRMHSGKHLGDR